MSEGEREGEKRAGGRTDGRTDQPTDRPLASKSDLSLAARFRSGIGSAQSYSNAVSY